MRIRAYPADAQILIDDQVAGVGVVLDASVPKGARRLRVKAPGYRTFDSTFSVLAGELTQIPKITLTATDEPK